MKEIRFPGKWSCSLNWWITYPPGPVRYITKEELGDYQSPYVTAYNTLLDAGWYYLDKRWYHPDGHPSFESIYKAYDYLKVKEFYKRNE
jgi:hypothetical protein